MKELIHCLRNPPEGTPTASAALMLRASNVIEILLDAVQKFDKLIQSFQEG